MMGTVLVVIAAAGAGAQSRRTVSTASNYSVGLAYGLQDGISITDGATNTQWTFGYTSQIRATLDMRVAQLLTLGVAAGFSNAPLTYTTLDGSGACGLSCQAHASITQYLATAQFGRGRGTGVMNQFELEGGVTKFADFHDDATNTALPPTAPGFDPSFGVGDRFGYAFSPMNEIYFQYLVSTVLHNQGSSTVHTTPPRNQTYSVGFTVGF
jgi:hypothetical protein